MLKVDMRKIRNIKITRIAFAALCPAAFASGLVFAFQICSLSAQPPAQRAGATLYELRLEIEEQFGARQAEFCGALLGTRRDLGLSLGDCVCLTTAAWLGAVAVTADRRWKELDGAVVNEKTIRVELIR